MSIEEKVEALIRVKVKEKVQQAERTLRDAMDAHLPFGAPQTEAQALIDCLRPLWEARFREDVEHEIASELVKPTWAAVKSCVKYVSGKWYYEWTNTTRSATAVGSWVTPKTGYCWWADGS